MDQFVNYQLQANAAAHNQTLARLATRGNGQHAARDGLGGSTIGSVNLQSARTAISTGRPLTPTRVGYALHHSHRTQDTMWVFDTQTNVDTVPASRRQQSALYHSNPYQG